MNVLKWVGLKWVGLKWVVLKKVDLKKVDLKLFGAWNIPRVVSADNIRPAALKPASIEKKLVNFGQCPCCKAALFAIPIEIHTTNPAHANFDPSKPNQWYEFTRKDLFEFEANRDGLKAVGYIEADSTNYGIALPVGSGFGDRALLLENSVF